MNKELEVINELNSIATLLDIELDYVIDEENKREYLVCNNTKICTNGTSIRGIREEFLDMYF